MNFKVHLAIEGTLKVSSSTGEDTKKRKWNLKSNIASISHKNNRFQGYRKTTIMEGKK